MCALLFINILCVTEENKLNSSRNSSVVSGESFHKNIESNTTSIDLDMVKIEYDIPLAINELYMHEISNINNSMVKWIACILEYAECYSTFFSQLYFDESNLNNNSIKFFCKALQRRKLGVFYFDDINIYKLYGLRHLSLGHNHFVSDKFIGELLQTLYDICPNCTRINLCDTNISNITCKTIFDFYDQKIGKNGSKNVVNLNKKIYFKWMPKFTFIDLSKNFNINDKGIEFLNDVILSVKELVADFENESEKQEKRVQKQKSVSIHLKFDVKGCTISGRVWCQNIIWKSTNSCSIWQ